MGTIVAVLSVVSIVLSGCLAAAVNGWLEDHRYRVEAEAALKGSRVAADRFEKMWRESEGSLSYVHTQGLVELREHAQVVEGLFQRIEQVRVHARGQYEQKEAKLLLQIMSMAERLATLRLQPVVSDEGTLTVYTENDVPFVEDESIPYSLGLHDFVKAITTEEARGMVETYIEERRANFEDDAQILTQLERGDY